MDLLDWWIELDKSYGVKLNQIPEKAKNSFKKFMFGKTYTVDETDKQPIFYSWDVGEWVYSNTDEEV